MGMLSLFLVLGAAAEAGELVVLQLAQEPPGQSEEQRFADELSLAMDDLVVSLYPPEDPGFVLAPLTAQVERVRFLLGADGAEAVAWLDGLGPDHLGLSVVFVTDDRAVVRLVQAERGQDVEVELALAAREILWSALGDAAPATPANSDEAPSPGSKASTPTSEPPPVGARVTLQGELSPMAQVGPGPRLGLEVAADLFFAERLAMGLGISGWSSLAGEVGGMDVRVSRAAAALRVQLWTLPVAPFVQAELPLTWVVVGDEWGTHVSPRGGVGLSAHWGSLVAEVRAGVWLYRDYYLHVPTDQVVYDSGRWDLLVGIGWRGPS